MGGSTPDLPPFGREELCVEFALWLRDELKARGPDTAKILARIVGVTEETIVNYTKGRPDGSPSFSKSLSILYALNGYEVFWERLCGRPSLVSMMRASKAAIDRAPRTVAGHPPRADLEEALDLILEEQVALAELANIIRTEMKLLDYQRERNGATPIRPRAVPDQ